MSLSERETKIAKFEQRILENPEDEAAHDYLLSNYVGFQMETGNRHPRYTAHIVRAIVHVPRTSLCRCPYVIFDKKDFPEEYIQAEAAWEKHLISYPEDLLIIRGAAYFQLFTDRKKAIDLLKKAAKPKTSHADVWLDIALFSLDPTQELYYLEEATRLGAKQPNLLAWTARAACKAENFKKAEKMGTNLLALAEDALKEYGSIIKLPYGEDSQDYAEANFVDQELAEAFRHKMHHYAEHEHWGQITLGLVAVSQQNWKNAVEHLHAAAQVNGSYRLSSYGPSFDLAEALCKNEMWSEVRSYLADCKRFWDEPVLDIWLKDLDSQKTPDFSSR